MNKVLWIILVILFLGLLFLTLNYAVNDNDANIDQKSSVYLNQIKPAKIPIKKIGASEPIINAKAVYLIDIDSAYPLYAKNSNHQLPIASTTKIATAMVVLDSYGSHLSDVVTISRKMVNVEPSVINLRVGEKITVENLLNGLLIMSGNDSAYSLAEYFGGMDSFVKEMNAKVSQIGLINTRYFDPAGLDDNGYSTAKDLATLASYAYRNQKFSEIVSTPEKNIASQDGRIIHELTNSNRLIRASEIYFYPNSIGGKTGFTYAAGHVLVSAAQKDGHRILAVILNTNANTTDASARESKKMLEWGFENWVW